MVNRLGDTTTLYPSGALTLALYFTVLSATLVTVRITVCDPASSATPIDAMLRSLASDGMPMPSRKSHDPA